MAKQTSSDPHPLGRPSVIGLKGSRKVADQHHRRKRAKQTMSSFVAVVLLVGVVAAVGYVGYTIYGEQQADEKVERDQRLAQIDAERQGRTTDDLIDDLVETPRWNGPGAPAFGVGDNGGIDITDGNLGG